VTIQLIDSADAHGYQVTVGHDTAIVSRFLSIANHGGWEATYLLAKQAEADLVNLVPAPLRRSRPRTPVAGIRVEYRARGRVKPTLCVVATWSHLGRCGQAAFSTRKHGQIGAVDKAMRRRERELGFKYELTAWQVWERIARQV
jgi:hypothetical protein